MNHVENGKPSDGLTVTEISNIWSTFLKISMELRLFQYFNASADDMEIKNVTEKLVNHCEQGLNELHKIFKKEKLTAPIGFTEEDVIIDAHKVFSDTFMLYFCHDITMLSMSTYPSALSDCSRRDVREFFQIVINFSMETQNELVDLMVSKGVYLKPPQIVLENELDFVDSKKYLSGIFDDSRPLNAAEITNLTRIIHRAHFSKMIFVSFSKLANSKGNKQYFSKGRDKIEYVQNSIQEIFEKENIPISASGDYLIFDVEKSPFSDKLMLFFVNVCLGMFCFAMIGQAMNSSVRSDIIYKLTKISNKLRKYYGEGLLLMIKENWLEEPPQAIDRKV